MSWEDLASEYKVLREAIHDDLKRHHFFHYIPRFSALVVEFDEKWKPVIEGFPSTKDDAFAAIDCIALGYGTAGVFHLMRVLERGIAVLAFRGWGRLRARLMGADHWRYRGSNPENR